VLQVSLLLLRLQWQALPTQVWHPQGLQPPLRSL